MQLAASAPVDRETLRRVMDAALPAARDRAALLAEVRGALAVGDDRAALALMRRYCGLPAVEIVP